MVSQDYLIGGVTESKPFQPTTMEEATFVKSHIAALGALPTTYPNDFQAAPEDFPRKVPIFPVSRLVRIIYNVNEQALVY